MDLVQIVILLLICISGTSANPLNLQLNELNMLSLDHQGGEDFIEIKSNEIRFNDDLLLGYYILVVNGLREGYGPTIETVINLRSQYLKRGKKYFVIGGFKISTADMGVNDVNFMFTNKLLNEGMTFLPQCLEDDCKPYGVILIYTKNPNPPFQLTKEKPFLPIQPSLQQFLNSNSIDMIVYGTFTTNTNRCAVFEAISPSYVYPIRKNYVLTEVEYLHDASIGKCTPRELTTFDPESFKIGKSTPGEINDCSGIGFIIDQNYIEFMVHRIPAVDPDQNEIRPVYEDPTISDQEACVPYGISQGKFNAIHPWLSGPTLNKVKNDYGKCEMKSTKTGSISSQLKYDDARLKQDFEMQTELEDWESTKYFDNDWIHLIERHQRELLPFRFTDDTKKWFEYLYNDQQPVISRFRCRICHKYAKTMQFSNHLLTDIMSENGALADNKVANRRRISGHKNTEVHKKIIEVFS